MGKTPFYSFKERTSKSHIALLEDEIAKLPKDPAILGLCDFMRGGVKATIIQQRGIAVDVAVTNYGYSGPTIACILKYMHKNSVGTQVAYMKKGAKGMYTVFVTD